MSWLKSETNGCLLTIKATPRASRNEIAGAQPDWLRVRLQAPPVDGKANAALVAFLAEKLDVSKRDLVIVAGETSRLKTVRIAVLTADEVCKRLGVL